MLTGIEQSGCSKIESGKRYYTFEQFDTGMDYLGADRRKNAIS